MASGSGDKTPQLPRGLIGRRGAPTGKAARLPSLKGPRDLTLGGVPKKVFTPNIPSRKDKAKSSPVVSTPRHTSAETSCHSREESHRDRGRTRGRGRGRGQDNVIQSHSIFEQGPGERHLPKGGNTTYDGGDRIPTSRVTIKKEKKDAERSKEILDHLLRDDFISDVPEGDPNMIPVHLPLEASVKKEERIENIPKVKSESGDIAMESDESSSQKLSQRVQYKIDSGVFTARDLLSKCAKTESGEQLLFFHLPDVLPGLPPSRDEQPRKKSQTEQTKPDERNEDSENISKKLAMCSLSDFSEGFIGKLQVRKSGKAQLVLGSVTLDVSVGTPCGFLQDLVCIRTEGNSGHMTMLGHIRDRLVCTPDFETLLHS